MHQLYLLIFEKIIKNLIIFRNIKCLLKFTTGSIGVYGLGSLQRWTKVRFDPNDYGCHDLIPFSFLFLISNEVLYSGSP